MKPRVCRERFANELFVIHSQIVVMIIILNFLQPQENLDQPKPISMALTMLPTNTTQPIAGPTPTLTCNWTLHNLSKG
jgi:hypothetical protein